MSAKRTSLRAAIVAVAVMPGLVLGPSASADSVARKDRRGDAPKAVDIVHWKAKNGTKSLVFTFRFKSLRKRKLMSVGAAVVPKGKNQSTGFIFGFRRKHTGRPFHRFAFKALKPHKCKAMRFRQRRDTVRLRVSQRCLGKQAGRLRFQLAAAAFSHDRADDSTRLTRLVKRG